MARPTTPAGQWLLLPFLAWALGDTFEGFGSSSLAMLVFSGLVLWAAIKWQELRAALFAWIDQDERSGI